jgi:hypothetical protein
MLRRFALLGVGFALLAGRAPAAGPEEALKTVPPTANVLAIVNAKQLRQSSAWRFSAPANKGGKEPADQPFHFLPDDAGWVVTAGHLNYRTGDWNWRAVLVQDPKAPSVDDVAGGDKAQTDEVGGQKFARLGDGYYGKWGDGWTLVFHPANRQALSRWVRHARAAKSPALNPVLAGAALKSAADPVVIAADLTDSIDPRHADALLHSLLVLQSRKDVDYRNFSYLLSKAQSLVFTVEPGNPFKGAIQINFGMSTANQWTLLKGIFLELLERTGAVIPELYEWRAGYPNNAMTLTGDLSAPSLRRVIGIFSFPQLSTGGGKPGESDPALSQQYLRAIGAVVNQTYQTVKQKRSPHVAAWFDLAARQVMQLNSRGVDPIALEAGSEVAKRLQAAAGTLRGATVDLKALAQSQYYYQTGGGYHPAPYGYPYGWWTFPFGGWGVRVRTNIPQVRAKMAETAAERAKVFTQLRQDIDSTLTRAAVDLKNKPPKAP